MTITINAGKHIEYDRITKDYAARYEGELIGYFKTYHDASVALDAYVYELLSSPLAQTATALDGGSIDALLTIEAGAALGQTLASLDTQPEPAPAFAIGQRVSCPAGWGRITDELGGTERGTWAVRMDNERAPRWYYYYRSEFLTLLCTACGKQPAVGGGQGLCAGCLMLLPNPKRALDWGDEDMPTDAPEGPLVPGDE